MQKINVLFLLGLFGEKYSAGLYPLRERIRQIPGVDWTFVAPYTARSSYISLINSFRDPTVLGPAHSFGENAALEIARAVKPGKVPLILGLDASQYWNTRTWWTEREIVPDHIPRAVHFYQRQSLIRGVLHVRADGSTRGIENIQVPGPHPIVDDLPIVHNRCALEIEQLVARLNPPMPKAA
jgi:hypothetical protein